MTKRKPKVHRHSAPLSLDQQIRSDDSPASEPIPEHVRDRLSEPRVTITLRSSRSEVRLQPGDRSTLVLPPGAFVGLPIEKGGFHRRGSLPRVRDVVKHYQPAWAPFVRRPRIAGLTQKYIRRSNGRLVIPTDVGRAYGEYPPRSIFYPSGYPWQCTGKLLIWSDLSTPNPDTYASAALVGDRVVLTAAHAVPWETLSNAKMQFVAGSYDGASVSGPGGQSWVTYAQGYVGHDVSAHDMAVVRLQDPLGSWLGYLGTKAYSSDWEGGDYWHLVGYPTAVSSDRPSWQGWIHVIDDDEDGDGQELEHHGDDTGGDSGGPFFGFWDDGAYAIGTVSGYEVVSGVLGVGDEDNNIVAGGDALNSLVKWGRDNWPK